MYTKCWQRRWKNLRPDKVLSMLGIAAKSGSVVSGEFSTEKAVKEGRAYLVIVAGDSSDNTKKIFPIWPIFMRFQCIFILTKRHWDTVLEKNFVPSLGNCKWRACPFRGRQIETDNNNWIMEESEYMAKESSWTCKRVRDKITGNYREFKRYRVRDQVRKQQHWWCCAGDHP